MCLIYCLLFIANCCFCKLCAVFSTTCIEKSRDNLCATVLSILMNPDAHIILTVPNVFNKNDILSLYKEIKFSCGLFPEKGIHFLRVTGSDDDSCAELSPQTDRSMKRLLATPCTHFTFTRPGTLFGTHAWKVLENHLPAHLDVLFLKAIPFVEEIGHPYVSHDYFRRQSSREVAFIHKNCFAKVLDSNSSDSAMDNSLSSYGYRALRTCSLVKYVETESAFVFDGSSPTRNHQKFRLCGVYRATTTYSDVSICSFLYSRKLADNFSKALLVYTDMNRSASILRYKSLRKLCPASRDTIPIFPNASFLSPESYGYMATNYVINSLLTEKYTKIINCSHFLISNADNLYHPNIIHYLSRPLLANIGMIAFSFISRYTLLKYIPEFVRDRVDLGSVIVNRACMMATHHLGPFNGDGPGGWFPADGNFFSKAIQYPACTNSLVDRTLFFHQ